ncbi:4Fe-4S dicluster domain-containing protein [Campylobacter sp. 19-13652]|uniref:4Fe-4S dicluster domain-containing protein n=1 Tax=Campylobacter sp. 19-13652 TaxID=2840180 RepID=UPI001C73ED38|nr:4Fe-4S dicluster domain-containing protein [Campylobacter sp. 19-13652]BCX79980.1 ferredoxin [Campylobacter sp. 19-13652]
MKEFGYFGKPIIPLNDAIEISQSGRYLVSNDARLEADVIAPEIDFYIACSKASALEVSKGVSLLYESRAQVYDLARDVPYEKQVGNRIIIVSNEPRDTLKSLLCDSGYEVISLASFEVKFVYGAVGELSVILSDYAGTNLGEVECDLLLASHAAPFMLRQSGCFDIAALSDEAVLEIVKGASPKYKFKSLTTYDESICQYAKRRDEICARCVEVCPTVAILKDDENRQLVFSHVDCVGCGECVSVCPSGSLDFAPFMREAWASVARLYEGKVALVVADESLYKSHVSLPENVLPLALGARFLTQAHLMGLLQESGCAVVLYDSAPARGTSGAVDIINQIYELKFNKKAIYLAKNLTELEAALNEAGTIEGSYYNMSENALLMREIFAKRVEHLVGDSELGTVHTDERVRYANVIINEDKCTLCLSCVGACNVGALIADKKDNSIKFNASICTACGYCESSCAEPGAIEVRTGELRLAPASFEFIKLASDELFACIECGKEFATKKSIEKIASIMLPHFGADSLKARTLYCCGECKAKIMFEAQIKQQRGDIDV